MSERLFYACFVLAIIASIVCAGFILMGAIDCSSKGGLFVTPAYGFPTCVKGVAL